MQPQRDWRKWLKESWPRLNARTIFQAFVVSLAVVFLRFAYSWAVDSSFHLENFSFQEFYLNGIDFFAELGWSIAATAFLLFLPLLIIAMLLAALGLAILFSYLAFVLAFISLALLFFFILGWATASFHPIVVGIIGVLSISALCAIFGFRLRDAQSDRMLK